VSEAEQKAVDVIGAWAAKAIMGDVISFAGAVDLRDAVAAAIREAQRDFDAVFEKADKFGTENDKLRAEVAKLKAELERKELEWIGMKSEVQVCHQKLEADATYHRNKVDELATLTSQLRAEVAKLDARIVEQDAQMDRADEHTAELMKSLDAGFVRGLERAKEIVGAGSVWINAIQAEITAFQGQGKP
jgi:predicted RNase H-like nuclease (RuvC/YqgF family)